MALGLKNGDAVKSMYLQGDARHPKLPMDRFVFGGGNEGRVTATGVVMRWNGSVYLIPWANVASAELAE
jgi:hypothetical protein